MSAPSPPLAHYGAPPGLGLYRYAPLVVRDYLVSVLGAGVRVCTDAPAQRPPLLVLITSASTADGTNIALSWRRLTLYCSATGAAGTDPAEVQAGRLSETVFGHLKSVERLGRLRGVPPAQQPTRGIRALTVVGTPARNDDPDEDIPRFQLTVDVLLRAGTPTEGDQQ